MSYRNRLDILIINQSEIECKHFNLLLKEDKTCAYSFRYAFSGKQGLEELRSGVRPDCIFLNYYLPDMDGVCFLRHLLTSTGSTAFPVLVFSDGVAEAAIFQSLQHGAQDFFLKEKLTTENLRRVVHYSVERHEINRKLHQAYTQVNSILETIMEGFVALDRKWRFTYINQHAEIMLRHKRTDLLGRGYSECFPELENTDLPLAFRNFLSTEAVSKNIEIFYSPLQSWFELNAYKTSEGEVTVYFTDITQRKSAEKLLRNRENYQLALLELARQALVASSFSDICSYTAEVVSKAIDCEHVLVFEHRPKNDTLSLHSQVLASPKNETALPIQPIYQIGYTFITGHTISTNKTGTNKYSFKPTPFPITTRNDGGYSETGEEIEVFDNLLTLAIPSNSFEQFYGVLAIANKKRTDIYNEDELQFLKAIANLLGLIHERMAVGDMQKALEKERELSELKSQFISMTSHEFRTPLSVILSSAELLEQYYPKLSAESKLTHFQKIRSSVKHMTEMLNNVLVIGKAEAGKLQFKPEILDVIRFCKELIDEFYVETSQSRLIFEVGADMKTMPAMIDRNLMRQILINLISNGLKYSPANTCVTLKVDYCPQQKLVFCVKDQGIGILPEDLPNLFEMFQRGSNTNHIPGTGLGLAIVKRSLDLHGGTIDVESIPNQGTVFTVTIPVTPLITE